MAAVRGNRAVKEGIFITRIFDAPRELVWKAFTEPEHFKRWWGPRGFTAPFCTIDLRVGGVYLASMRSSQGQDIWSTGVYREIVPMERLVYTQSLADENGNVVPDRPQRVSADFPRETLVTVTFEDDDGKTKMTMRHAGLPAGPGRDGAEAGWNEAFDKLAESLR